MEDKIKAKKEWKTHGMSSTKIYRVYRWILTRCNDSNNPAYHNYWWRWIKCEWNSFQEFYTDIKELYSEWLTIDRIDNDWNYSKENCRFVDRKQQQRNKRNTIMYKWLTLQDWSEKLWIKYITLYVRKLKWWSMDEVVWITPHLERRWKYIR